MIQGLPLKNRHKSNQTGAKAVCLAIKQIRELIGLLIKKKGSLFNFNPAFYDKLKKKIKMKLVVLFIKIACGFTSGNCTLNAS